MVMIVWVVSFKQKRQWNTLAIFSTKEKALKDMKRRAKDDKLAVVEVGSDMWMMGDKYLLEAWTITA